MRRRHLFAFVPVALAAACAQGPLPPTVTVFFTEDNAELDTDAQAVVRRTAAAAKEGTGPVTVLGFAGPAGGAAYNRALSERRAQHVADLLERYGVARGRITISGRGPVPYEQVATESRRVEIIVAPPRR